MLDLVVTILAIGSLIFALIAFQRQLNDLNSSREHAAIDSCYLLRGLVLAAAKPGKISAARDYIDRTSLRDCNVYGQSVLHGKSVVTIP